MSDVLLEAALRATLIAAAALVALWLLRVRAAAVRHRVWTVVMLAMLALPPWIAYGPEITLRVLPPTDSSLSGAIVTPPNSAAPIRQTTTPKVASTADAAAGASAVESAAGPAAKAWTWRAGLLAIYLAGVAVLLTRLAIGTARVRSLERGASIVDGQVTSNRIATPFTVGLLRPTVLLPEGWDRWPPARLAAVLDHERAHVARRDPLVQWLALLNRAIFWFHPLAWWLERHLAALAEEACDGAVLASGRGRADYAEHLLDLARAANRRPMRLVGMPMPGSMLPMRIARILEGDVGPPGSRTAVAGAAAVAALAASVLATITLGQEPTPSEEATPAQEPTPAQGAASARGLLEVYRLSLDNDPAALEEEAAQQALLMRVADAYFDVLAAKDMLAAEEAASESLSELRDQAQRRFEVGLTSITQVLEARAGSSQAAVDVLAAEREVASAMAELRRIVGADIGELSPLIEDLPLTAPDPDAALPTERETRDLYPAVVANIARVRALEEALRASRTALKATRAGFDSGTRTTLDVLAQQNNAREVETTYRLSRYDYVASVLRLEQATGNLTVDRLEEIESWLQ